MYVWLAAWWIIGNLLQSCAWLRVFQYVLSQADG